MRWIGGPLLVALALGGAGCVAPSGAQLSPLSFSEAATGAGAATSFTLDGDACLATTFAFEADAARVRELVWPPFHPVGLPYGPTPVLALHIECDTAMIAGTALGGVALGGLFALVDGPMAESGAVNLFALQAYSDQRALVDGIRALGGYYEHSQASRLDEPEMTHLGLATHILVPLRDGGYRVDGGDAALLGVTAPTDWVLWSDARQGFVRMDLATTSTSVGGGQGELDPARGSLADDITEGDDENASGVLARYEFAALGRVDFVA